MIGQRNFYLTTTAVYLSLVEYQRVGSCAHTYHQCTVHNNKVKHTGLLWQSTKEQKILTFQLV